MLGRIVQRVIAVLRRRGRLDDEEPERLTHLRARQDGVSLHAGTALHANDRIGLERLCRYGLRPPLAVGRLTEAADGSVLYEMKRRFADGRRVLRFAPRDLLLRLCALVPPRGFHMVHYAGIFSAHARGRRALTGRGMHDRPASSTRENSQAPRPVPLLSTPARAVAVANPPVSRISNEAVLPLPLGRRAGERGPWRDRLAPDEPTRAQAPFD